MANYWFPKMTRMVSFYSRNVAESLIQPHYIISVGEKDDGCQIKPIHKKVLRLIFSDVIESVAPNAPLFNAKQAFQIIDWLETIPKNELVIVHCEAGVSRSAAIAKFMVEHLGYELKSDKYCSIGFAYANKHVFKTLEDAYLLSKIGKAR